MRKTFLIVVLGAAILSSNFPSEAQQKKKVYRIGYLSHRLGIGPLEEAFRQGLRELGYIEGDNLVIEWRFTKGRLDLHPEAAAELVRLKLDCIVTSGLSPSRAAKQATSTIPIVMANVSDDPVRHGLIASLARPGGNITGFTDIAPDLAGKRLELLKETVPSASRVAVLWLSASSVAHTQFKESATAAQFLGIDLQSLEVRGDEDVNNSFRVAAKTGVQALIVVTFGGFINHRDRIVDLAVKNRLPAMYTGSQVVDVGGLMSYAPDGPARLRRVAVYVDKILKGTMPADLPVEQPMKFELVINLKTAKQIGLTIPPNVLARADRVIR